MGLGCSNTGCCCGFVCGFVAVLLICAAAGFGIYCWFNPEARRSSITRVESAWTQFKSGGDELVEEVKNSSAPAVPVNVPVPEPVVIPVSQ